MVIEELQHVDRYSDERLDSMPDDDVVGLINSLIDVNSHRDNPEDARTVEGSVPVWAIISHLQAVNGDLDQTAIDYDVGPETVRASVAYYRRNRQLILARIAANADASTAVAV